MSSHNDASSSGSASERDSAESPAFEDPMHVIMSLLAQSLPSSATSMFQEMESDKDSFFDDSQTYDTPFDDTPSEISTTKEHSETESALEQQEEQVNSTKFTQIINALIECHLTQTEENNQRPQEPRRDLFEEHMREEALILDNLAGPNATAAEKKKAADETAEIRQRLADRSIETVAKSVARARLDRPKRVARAAKREETRYELELASMRRLCNLALETTPDGVVPDSVEAFERMSLRTLRTQEAGSFDDAVKTLFDRLWERKNEMEKAWEAEMKLMKQMSEEKGKAEKGGARNKQKKRG
ncbi:hypothetical protein VMCG_01632 [Cytospora schulzeri]|uniref:Uncharacterized protein n=1 Tax=Cytospora schulzeri TaxID=448051 RepID=A0A423X309_9PEZI|nr:hypothetical protein VMCG_01632 [Valsa malicola]